VLIDGLQQVVADYQLSSAHVLFPAAEELALLQQAGWLIRHGVQFHWQNQGYADFDAFLAALSQSKRKKIRQERRKVRDAGITISVLRGAEITDQHWQFLNAATARPIWNTARHRISTWTFSAWQGACCPATVFCLSPAGRPADCRQLVPARRRHTVWPLLGCAGSGGLPAFRAVLLQRHRIRHQHGLQCFEGGAQGEHKLARGFTPVITHSAHWIAHPQFRRAIADWLAREREAIGDYQQQLFYMPPTKPLHCAIRAYILRSL
jgi:predicted N-acyltransferase